MNRTVTPAYGRDYKSAGAAITDLVSNKDFILQPDGVYINVEQMEKGDKVNIRYNGMRKVTVYNVTGKEKQIEKS